MHLPRIEAHMITLRDYQVRAIAAAKASAANPLLVLATGLGKTTIFCELVREHVEAGGKALVIAHRKELLDQAMDRITEQTGLLATRGKGSSIVVESIQTLANRVRAQKHTPDVSLVILDEAHHAAAESYKTVFEHYKAARWIGVTATPDRQDALGLPFEKVFSYAIEDAVKDGWLVPMRYRLYKVNPPNSGKIRIAAGDFVLSDLASALDNSNEKILEVVSREAKGKRCIAFFPTVESAQHFAKEFCKAGFSADIVHGGTKKEDRDRIIGSYRAGLIDILCNCAVLTEGFDAPETDMVIMARPTKSESLYRQCIGRGSRLAPGKTDCIVLHFGFSSFDDFEVHPAKVGAKGESIEVDEMMRTAQAGPHPFEESTGELLAVRGTLQITADIGEGQFLELDRSASRFVRIMGLEAAGVSHRQAAYAKSMLPGFFSNCPQAQIYSESIIRFDRLRKPGMSKLGEAWFLWRWKLPPNIPRVIATRWIAEMKRQGLTNARRLDMIAELRHKIAMAKEHA